jgi:hypothetical protein
MLQSNKIKKSLGGWMDELRLYVLYFCTGKANQESQGQKSLGALKLNILLIRKSNGHKFCVILQKGKRFVLNFFLFSASSWTSVRAVFNSS